MNRRALWLGLLLVGCGGGEAARLAAPVDRPPVRVARASFGSFDGATGLAVDPRGTLYVADPARHLVISFSATGDSLTSIGGYGWEGRRFDRPTDLVADGLAVDVADFGNNRVERYDRRLNYLGSLSGASNANPTRTERTADDAFEKPLSVGLASQGDLYILDGEARHIVRFNPFSRERRVFGGIDAGAGRLEQPQQLAVGPDGLVYVSDVGRNGGRVVVFDPFGSYIRTIGDVVLRAPAGLGLDADGVLWVADPGLGAVVPFTAAGLPPADKAAFSLPVGDQPQDVTGYRGALYVLGRHRIYLY